MLLQWISRGVCWVGPGSSGQCSRAGQEFQVAPTLGVMYLYCQQQGGDVTPFALITASPPVLQDDQCPLLIHTGYNLHPCRHTTGTTNCCGPQHENGTLCSYTLQTVRDLWPSDANVIFRDPVIHCILSCSLRIPTVTVSKAPAITGWRFICPLGIPIHRESRADLRACHLWVLCFSSSNPEACDGEEGC